MVGAVTQAQTQAKPQSTPPQKPREAARKLVDSGVITAQSSEAIASLMFLTNLQQYLAGLKHRIACAMHICNQYGVMAGLSGGGSGNTEVPTPLVECNKNYRTSQSSQPPPSVNLPTEPAALGFAASVSVMAPSEDDKSITSTFNNTGYTPFPLYRPKKYYRKLDGPPLAPQKMQSRTITNYQVGTSPEGASGFTLEATWENILAKVNKGSMPFIKQHFDGIGQRKRDLRGATGYERAQIKRQIDSWVRDSMRGVR